MNHIHPIVKYILFYLDLPALSNNNILTKDETGNITITKFPTNLKLYY